MLSPTGWWQVTVPTDLRCGMDRLLVHVREHWRDIACKSIQALAVAAFAKQMQSFSSRRDSLRRRSLMSLAKHRTD